MDDPHIVFPHMVIVLQEQGHLDQFQTIHKKAPKHLNTDPIKCCIHASTVRKEQVPVAVSEEQQVTLEFRNSDYQNVRH